MTNGIIYFNHGTSHLARLAASLLSLRKHYAGEVTILASGGEGGIVERIAKAAGARVQFIIIPARRRNTCYVAKASLWKSSPYETSLLLDSDTIVAADPSPLLAAAEAESSGIVLTRFAAWTTHKNIIAGRINRWKNIRCEGFNVREAVAESFAALRPAINTGVVAWRSNSPFLPLWENLTVAGRDCSLTDEIAAQLLSAVTPCLIEDSRYNASPIYHRGDPHKVVIWHPHGAKHVRLPDGRGSEGHEVWWPLFAEAWRENYAGIRTWAPAGDVRLAPHVSTLRAAA